MVASLTRRVFVVLACLLWLPAPLLAFAQDEAAYASDPWVDTETLPGATLFRHPASGAVKNLYGTFSFYGVEDTPEGIARMFLSSYADVLDMRRDTADLIFDGVIEGEALRHVWFHQEYQGIPIWRGSVVIHMTRNQEIVKCDSNYVPASTIPRLQVGMTVEAVKGIAVSEIISLTGSPTLGTRLATDAGIFLFGSDEGPARLIYAVTGVDTASALSWEVLVDAVDGKVVRSYPLWVEYYTADGLAFNPDPVTTSGNHALPNNNGYDYAEINAERQEVTLQHLTLSSQLTGPWVKALPYGGSSASPPFEYTRANSHFEEVMAYYHTDRAQTYIQEVYGGETNDRQQKVYTNDTSFDGNAAYISYTRDIRLGRDNEWYIFPDAGEDGKVILHEYGHAMIDDTHGRDYGYPAYDFLTTESLAISEGYSDFFACNAFLHVEPAFSNDESHWFGSWFRSPTVPLRYVESSLMFADVDNPAGDAHLYGPFWADTLWTISKRIGRRDSDRLGFEWLGEVSSSPIWETASNDLLHMDFALNGGRNVGLILKTLLAKGVPGLSYRNNKYAYVEIEHADLSKLTVTLEVRRADQSLRYGPYPLTGHSGSGTWYWLVSVGTWTDCYPPGSDRIWYLKVQESSTDATIHDQGVIRDFRVFTSDKWDNPSNMASDTWVPILEDTTVQSRIPSLSVSNYAEITIGHSDLSQLELTMGVKDLADPWRALNDPASDGSVAPGFQLYLTKNGLRGWARPAEARVFRVNLDGLASRMPPSYARRWYLGIRDTVKDDYEGQLVGFKIRSGTDYNATGLPLAINDDTAESGPQYVNLQASPTSKSSACVRLTGFSPTVTVGAPGFSQPATYPYDNIDITSGQGQLPPGLDKRWSLQVPSASGTRYIDVFALYDKNAPRIYRSASPRVTMPSGQGGWAYVPYSTTASFPDVPTSPICHWAWMQIEGVKKAGIAFGYGDGLYHPEYQVPRSQMATFIARAHHGTTDLVGYTAPTTPTFPDVPTGHPAFRFVEYCYSREIVRGYPDGLYYPDIVITRDQLAVYIARAIGGCNLLTPRITARYTDVPTSHWAFKEIEYLSGSMNASGGVVVSGYLDGLYHPTDTVLRDGMAVFIARGFSVPQ